MAVLIPLDFGHLRIIFGNFRILFTPTIGNRGQHIPAGVFNPFNKLLFKL